MDINEQIYYEWKLGWDSNGMTSPRPKVNRLLKAIIEKNITEMQTLFKNGATLEKVDEETFGRILYHVMDNYGVIKCLVDNGFSRIYDTYDKWECITPDAYVCGVLGRAICLGNHMVIELIARNGFAKINGHNFDGVEIIFKRNDVHSAKVLLENGYNRGELEDYSRAYPHSKVSNYLTQNPVVKRKSIALEWRKYCDIPTPKFEKPGLFNRRKVEARNEILRLDYDDLLRAQREFKQKVGFQKWEQRFQDEQESTRLFINMAKKL